MAPWSSRQARLPEFPRVLLAEDDMAMRGLLAEALRRDGYDVAEAANIAELRDEATDSLYGLTPWPRVIVSDRYMPGGDLLELITEIRARGLDVPILIVTAFAEAAVFDRAFALGRCLVLSKPVSMDAVRVAVARLVSGAPLPA